MGSSRSSSGTSAWHGVRRPRRPRSPKPAAAVLVPRYNETQSLPYLSKTLQSPGRDIRRRVPVHLSVRGRPQHRRDLAMLAELFGGRPEFVLLRHPGNQVFSAAIQTGIRNAPDYVVCSIDCD